MEISLSQFGQVLFYAPAGLLVYLTREWARATIAKTFQGEEPSDPLAEQDLLALVAWSFSGLSWGGFCRRGRQDTLLTFLAAQGWFIVLLAGAIFYSRLKGLEPNTFMGTFFSAVIYISWAGLCLNFLPLPPFDASWFYMQPLYEARFTAEITVVWKVTLALFFVFYVSIPHFLRGNFLLHWAGLL